MISDGIARGTQPCSHAATRERGGVGAAGSVAMADELLAGVGGETAQYWCVVVMMCLKCAFIEMFCEKPHTRFLTFLTYGWTLRRLPRVWQAPLAR